MKDRKLQVGSIIFAAGKGSRMIGYEGNKTLLPLIRTGSLYEGERPLLIEVLANLPQGPKGVVVNYRAEEVQRATEGLNISYHFQNVTNGTGGALLAARPFLQSIPHDLAIITMGDVPLIRPSTYTNLIGMLNAYDFVVLASEPDERTQYGMLEMDGEHVLRIVEWKYWHEYPPERQAGLRFCNGGVYAAKRPVLLEYLDRLALRPHRVRKQRGEEWLTIEEYFLTDIVELMSGDGLPVGFALAPEEEVMGVDTPEALEQAQLQYRKRLGETLAQ